MADDYSMDSGVWLSSAGVPSGQVHTFCSHLPPWPERTTRPCHPHPTSPGSQDPTRLTACTGCLQTCMCLASGRPCHRFEISHHEKRGRVQSSTLLCSKNRVCVAYNDMPCNLTRAGDAISLSLTRSSVVTWDEGEGVMCHTPPRLVNSIGGI